MTNRALIILGALVATVTLGVMVSGASANRLEISSATFRAAWTTARPLSFINDASSLTIRCPVTLEGTFHSRTFQKSGGELLGYITRAEVTSERCTGGSARILPESLPWHIQYEEFSGALPNITEIHIKFINAIFGMNALLTGLCLYKTESMHPGRAWLQREAGGLLTDIEPDSNITIQKIAGPGTCVGTSRLSGPSATLTQLGTTANIFVRLI
jgi:hypothetical protein